MATIRTDLRFTPFSLPFTFWLNRPDWAIWSTIGLERRSNSSQLALEFPVSSLYRFDVSYLTVFLNLSDRAAISASPTGHLLALNIGILG